MDNRKLVDVKNALKKGFHHFCDLVVCQQRLSFFVETLQLATTNELHLDHHEALVLVDSFEANDARVVKALHDF